MTEALVSFTDCAVVCRYPGAPRAAIPASAESEAWIEEIQVLKADFERWPKEKTGDNGKGRVR